MSEPCLPASLRDRGFAAHAAVDALALDQSGLSCAAARLHELIDEAAQEYALSRMPAAEVIGTFGRLLRDMRGASVPHLALTPAGGIRAEWSEPGARSVALVVQQSGSARLGAVLGVCDCDRGPLHLDVEGDIEAVVERLRTDRDLSWIVGAQSTA